MNKNQSKTSKDGFFDTFGAPQLALVALVILIVSIAVVSGVKSLSPISPQVSSTDLAARMTAKQKDPNLGYAIPPTPIRTAPVVGGSPNQ